MTEFDTVFVPGEEHKVTTASRKVALVVSGANEQIPRPVALRCAPARGLLRIAGGTSTNATPNEQRRLYDFARGMFSHANLDRIVIMSGATRILNESGRVVMSILELPTLIQQWNPTCFTMGSAPRTSETFSYQGDHSTFYPGDTLDSHTLAHPGIDLFWSVQVDASEVSDWSGDLKAYFELMDLLWADGKMTGLLVFGGGRVTAMEVRMALERNHPVAICVGSGRIADDIINWVYNPSLVSKTDRTLLQQWSDEGFDIGNFALLSSPQEGTEWLSSIGLTQ